MSINIGDKNKIKNSSIGHSVNINDDPKMPPKKENFTVRHPWIYGMTCSFVIGVILLFAFWKDVITWFENLFK